MQTCVSLHIAPLQSSSLNVALVQCVNPSVAPTQVAILPAWWVTLHVHPYTPDVNQLSMHFARCRVYSCPPQFSALFPEMLDAVILLDAFGFIPTDSVIAHLLFIICILQNQGPRCCGSASVEGKKPKLFFSALVGWFLTSKHFLIVFLQKEISKIMRQGIEEMIQHEKNKDKPPKVYTYEKAAERYL